MDLKNLPKVELHRHLELSLRPQTIKELAPQIGIDLPDDETFAERFLIQKPMADLGSVLNKFLDTQKLLNSEEILERVAFEAIEDAYKEEGIRILELRYAPTFVQQNHQHLTFESVHEAFTKGLQKATMKYPIAVGLICIIQRVLPVKEAEAVTDFAIEHKDTFLGLDLADNEVGFDCKPFAPFFKKAKKAGLGITVHAGEANVPEGPQTVVDAIERLDADRIGHGVQIHKDPKVIDIVKSRNIPLELCPTSNWLTNAVKSTQDHPIRQLMEAGVPVTINTDDPGIFGIDLVHEYALLRDQHNFTDEEFKKCNEIAFKASFIGETEKKRAWDNLAVK